MCDLSIVRESYTEQEKILFWGPKRSAKAIFEAKNQYGRVIYRVKNFTSHKKKYTFGGQKRENKPSESKNGT
jgi:hypothetical protein